MCIQSGELSDVVAMLCEMVSQLLQLPPTSQVEPEEAKRHLLEANGNFDLAMTLCVAKRREVVEKFVKEFSDCDRNAVMQVHGLVVAAF